MAKNNEFEGFYPRQDRVLVKVDDANLTTKGGIIIPETSQDAEKPNRGIVLAVGPKVTDLKVGERVLYGQYSGFTITHLGVEYRLIRAEDAFASVVQQSMTDVSN